MMSVTVQLDSVLPDTIYYEFHDRWTWTEYMRAFEQELVLARSLEHYAVIACLLKGDYVPVGSAFFSMYSTFRRTPPSMDLLIIVTLNPVVQYMANVMGRIYPEMRSSFQVVESMEEARQRLRERPAAGSTAMTTSR